MRISRQKNHESATKTLNHFGSVNNMVGETLTRDFDEKL